MTSVVPQPVLRHPPQRIGNWLPTDSWTLVKFVQHLVKDLGEEPGNYKGPVKELRELIESTAELRMLASAMFTEVPDKAPYQKDPFGAKAIKSYYGMLNAFSKILGDFGDPPVVPEWKQSYYDSGLIGFPFNAVLDWPMATPSGYGFFLKPDINKKLKEILDKWNKTALEGSSSLHVLDPKKGWLSPEAREVIEKDTRVVPGQENYEFKDFFECDPNKDYWGFKSWEDFFLRRFKNIDQIRKVAFKEDPHWLVNAAESKPFALQHNVKKFDTFWLKSQSYSVSEMLKDLKYAGSNKYIADDFVGGTVYQAFLSATSYHRWHSPVKGQVINTSIIQGTYFSEPTITGFTNPDGPDPAAPDKAQGYITHVATRAIIVIDTKGPAGIVAVTFVGMADLSSCQFDSKFQPGTNFPVTVEKGEEIGMFHYGGSTYALLLQPKVKLTWVTAATPSPRQGNVPVRSELAYIYSN